MIWRWRVTSPTRNPGALPTVTPGTLHQDLARRDFTINTMAVSLGEDSFGDLLDPSDGQSDLRTGAVRVLHDDSFRDDATRILRAVRYAVRLGFTLELNTECLIKARLGLPGCNFRCTGSATNLSGSCLKAEAAATLEMLQRLGALKSVYPGITLTPAKLQDSPKC